MMPSQTYEVIKNDDGTFRVVQVIASFFDKSRAEMYAELENDIAADERIETASLPAPSAEKPAPVATPKAAAPKPAPARKPAPKPKPAPGKSARDIALPLLREGVLSVSEIAERCGVSGSRISQFKSEMQADHRQEAKAPAANVAKQAPTPPRREPDKQDKPKDIATPDPGKSTPKFSRNGVDINLSPGQGKIIVAGGSQVALTDGQAKLAAMLLRAAPNPVGEDYLASHIFTGSISKTDAGLRLGHLISNLQQNLKGTSLAVKQIGDIGVQLTGVPQ